MERRGRRPGLGVAGLSGALLSLYPPVPRRILAETGLDVFNGAWLGIALAGYFVIAARSRSPLRALALVMLSAAAYWLAMMTAFTVELPLVSTGGGGTHEPHLVSLFAAGAVGALVLSAGAFFLYAAHRESLTRRLAICGVGGGLLGAAYDLGNVVQRGPHTDAFSTAVLTLVWQTGVPLLMGLVWPESAVAERPIDTVLQERATASPASIAPRVPRLVAILMVVAVVPLVLTFIRGAQTRHRMREYDHAIALYRSQPPPLPPRQPLVARAIDEVLILAPIDGRRVKSIGPAMQTLAVDTQHVVDYIACYSNVPGEECAVTEVRVTEYPNADWAAYGLRGIWTQNHYGLEPAVPTVVKFGQRMAQPTLPDRNRDVFWRSGAFVVRVRSWMTNDDSIVRAYLERYRSSL